MTFPFALDRDTPPEDVIGREVRSWMLAFGFLPVDRRMLRIEVFEEGRFRECSTGSIQGRWCHERTAVADNDGSTVLTDTLVIEPRGRVVGALVKIAIPLTFRRRHQRLRRHFAETSDDGRRRVGGT